jgi:tetratricopeptide (TPR) repeat protein
VGENWRELFDEGRRENGLGDVQRAEELFTLAIQAAENLPPDLESYSSAQGTFALLRHHQGRFAEAEAFQKRYIDAERRLGIGAREMGNLLMWLAEMQWKQSNFVVARATIEEAIKAYPATSLPELSQAHADLASVLAQLGDPTGASAAAKKSQELRTQWDNLLPAELTPVRWTSNNRYQRAAQANKQGTALACAAASG